VGRREATGSWWRPALVRVQAAGRAAEEEPEEEEEAHGRRMKEKRKRKEKNLEKFGKIWKKCQKILENWGKDLEINFELEKLARGSKMGFWAYSGIPWGSADMGIFWISPPG